MSKELGECFQINFILYNTITNKYVSRSNTVFYDLFNNNWSSAQWKPVLHVYKSVIKYFIHACNTSKYKPLVPVYKFVIHVCNTSMQYKYTSLLCRQVCKSAIKVYKTNIEILYKYVNMLYSKSIFLFKIYFLSFSYIFLYGTINWLATEVMF